MYTQNIWFIKAVRSSVTHLQPLASTQGVGSVREEHVCVSVPSTRSGRYIKYKVRIIRESQLLVHPLPVPWPG
jgi:hypothetical protein